MQKYFALYTKEAGYFLRKNYCRPVCDTF